MIAQQGIHTNFTNHAPIAAMDMYTLPLHSLRQDTLLLR